MDASVSEVTSRAETSVPERARSQSQMWSSKMADTPPKRDGEGARESPRGDRALIVGALTFTAVK